MKKMIWTKYDDEYTPHTEVVCFLSIAFIPNKGPRAYVVGKDNAVFTVDPYDLSLPADEYNRIFLK